MRIREATKKIGKLFICVDHEDGVVRIRVENQENLETEATVEIPFPTWREISEALEVELTSVRAGEVQ